MLGFETLCKGRSLLIPPNQRGFSWGKRQVTDLIKDLELAHENSQSHYVGPIIVTQTEAPSFADDDYVPTQEFLLEDGQQRLTTFFIFANQLRLKLGSFSGDKQASKAGDKLYDLVFLKHNGIRPRLRNAQPLLEQYLEGLLNNVPFTPALRVPAMDALDEVRKAVYEFVDVLDREKLLQWGLRISNQALFILVDLKENGLNRYLTFDAINSRGLPLSEFDKIKNFCILICSVRGIDAGVASAWYATLQELQKFNASGRTEEAAFIAELYSSFYGRIVSTRDVHTDFVDKYRTLLSTTDPIKEGELKHFVSLWQPYARSFGFIVARKRGVYYGVLSTKVAGHWLDRLDNMDLPTITRPLLVASHLWPSMLDFEKIARACEIYTFRVHAVLRRRKDANRQEIVGLAHEVLHGRADAAVVLRTFCSWLDTRAPLSEVINALSDGRPKYRWASGGWQYGYYFLYEYELSVSPAGVAPLPYATDQEAERNTQEHVLPQEHRDGGWWQSHWSDATEADNFKHRLGNLVLTGDNTQLGRKPFAEKLAAPTPMYCYSHSKATNSEKCIGHYSDGLEWRPSNILLREADLLKFAAVRWSVPCKADQGSCEITSPVLRAVGVLSLDVQLGECVDSVVLGAEMTGSESELDEMEE